MIKNYYIILGVKNTATLDEIKAAFRELAKKYHPDKNPGNKAAEDYFKEIQEAYMVLSNPEKRKNYDLKFTYGYTQSSSRRTAYGQYTGNAYQYAQQQAAARNNAAFNNLRSKTKQKHKPEERYQVMVSVGIALLLLYFIISYNTSNKKTTEEYAREKIEMEHKIEALMKPDQQQKNLEEEPMIHNFDSPYTRYFGEEVYVDESKNNIKISNSGYSEAVVCLVNNKAPFQVIRNQYMDAGATFKMNSIPDGEYYLKVFYGNKWDTTVTFVNQAFKGGFKEQVAFVKIMNGNKAFKMKQDQEGASSSYSSYEVDLNPNSEEEKKHTITEKEFFQ